MGRPNNSIPFRFLTSLFCVLVVISANDCHLKSSPKSPARCGVHVVPKKTNQASAPQYGSLSDCATWCKRMNPTYTDQEIYINCDSFTRNEKTGLCAFHNIYAGTFKGNSSSPYLLYDKGCFNCKHECPNSLDSSVNLAENGDFEISSEAGPWTITGPNAYHVGSGGVGSSNALITDVGGYASLFRSLCRNQLYLLKMQVRVNQLVNTPNLQPSVNFGAGDCNWNFPIQDQPDLLNTWQNVSCIFQTILARGDQITTSLSVENIRAGNVSEFEVLLDNVVITAIASETSPLMLETTGESLIQNGDFENGQLSPWSVSVVGQGARPNKPKHKIVSPGLGDPSSDHGLQLNLKDRYDYHYDEYYGDILLSQTTAATNSDKYYLLSFDYRGINSTGFYVNLNNYFFDATLLNHKDTRKVYNYARIFKGSGRAENLEVIFTADDLYDYARNRNGNPHQIVKVDNFLIHELVEGQGFN